MLVKGWISSGRPKIAEMKSEDTHGSEPEWDGSLREDDTRSRKSTSRRVEFLVNHVHRKDVGASRMRVLFPTREEGIVPFVSVQQ